jgi:DNA-binding transcriptional regulator YdaS (Cro superfamily)
LSGTTASLLVVAAEIAGGRKALAERLGISYTLLSRYMDESRALPDLLLLKAVDVILEDRRQPELKPTSRRAAQSAPGSLRDQ